MSEFCAQHLLAALLLSVPPDAPVTLTNEQIILVMPALQELALKEEILDLREVRFMLTQPEDFAEHLSKLQHRYQDLLDAPLVWESNRFPNRQTVNDFLAFNRGYRKHIDAHIPVELARAWELRIVLQQTDQLYQVWDTVRDASCEYYYVTVRRQALKRLREMIGEEHYYAGQLPYYVPTWYFEEIKP